MKDHIMTIVLFALLVWLAFKAPQYPAAQWRVPCAVFCVVGMLWLAPEVAKSLLVIFTRTNKEQNNVKQTKN